MGGTGPLLGGATVLQAGVDAHWEKTHLSACGLSVLLSEGHARRSRDPLRGGAVPEEQRRQGETKGTEWAVSWEEGRGEAHPGRIHSESGLQELCHFTLGPGP